MSAEGGRGTGRLGRSALSGVGALVLVLFCVVFAVLVTLAHVNPDPKNDPSWEPSLATQAVGYAAWVLVPSGLVLAGALPPLALGVGRVRSLLVSVTAFGISLGLAYALEDSPEITLAVAAAPALIVLVSSLLTNGGRASALVALAAGAYATSTYASYVHISGLACAVVWLAGWLALPALAGSSRPRVEP